MIATRGPRSILAVRRTPPSAIPLAACRPGHVYLVLQRGSTPAAAVCVAPARFVVPDGGRVLELTTVPHVDAQSWGVTPICDLGRVPRELALVEGYVDDSAGGHQWIANHPLAQHLVERLDGLGAAA